MMLRGSMLRPASGDFLCELSKSSLRKGEIFKIWVEIFREWGKFDRIYYIHKKNVWTCNRV